MVPTRKQSAAALNVVSDIFDSSTPNISKLLRSKTLQDAVFGSQLQPKSHVNKIRQRISFSFLVQKRNFQKFDLGRQICSVQFSSVYLPKCVFPQPYSYAMNWFQDVADLANAQLQATGNIKLMSTLAGNGSKKFKNRNLYNFFSRENLDNPHFLFTKWNAFYLYFLLIFDRTLKSRSGLSFYTQNIHLDSRV